MGRPAEPFARSTQIGRDRSAHQEMDLVDVIKKTQQEIRRDPMQDRFMLCQKAHVRATSATHQ